LKWSCARMCKSSSTGSPDDGGDRSPQPTAQLPESMVALAASSRGSPACGASAGSPPIDAEADKASSKRRKQTSSQLVVCWGYEISRKPNACERLVSISGAISGKSFRERFCSACRSRGVYIDSSRIYMAPRERSLKNAHTTGAWNFECAQSLTLPPWPPWRVVNQTSDCSGPPLVVLRDEALGALPGLVPLSPIAGAVAGTDLVEFRVGRTLRPVLPLPATAFVPAQAAVARPPHALLNHPATPPIGTGSKPQTDLQAVHREQLRLRQREAELKRREAAVAKREMRFEQRQQQARQGHARGDVSGETTEDLEEKSRSAFPAASVNSASSKSSPDRRLPLNSPDPIDDDPDGKIAPDSPPFANALVLEPALPAPPAQGRRAEAAVIGWPLKDFVDALPLDLREVAALRSFFEVDPRHAGGGGGGAPPHACPPPHYNASASALLDLSGGAAAGSAPQGAAATGAERRPACSSSIP